MTTTASAWIPCDDHSIQSGTLLTPSGSAFHRKNQLFAAEVARCRYVSSSCGFCVLIAGEFAQGDRAFDPVNLVCKLNEAGGRPAVKLSDNFQKALGPPAEIKRYRQVFGLAGIAHAPEPMR